VEQLSLVGLGVCPSFLGDGLHLWLCFFSSHPAAAGGREGGKDGDADVDLEEECEDAGNEVLAEGRE